MGLLTNSKGFSLIQVLVAAGLIGVISLGVAQVMVQSSRTSKATQNKLDQMITYSTLNDAIDREEFCKPAMQGNPFDGSIPAKQEVTITMPDGTVYQKGNPVPNTDLIFESLNLKAISPAVTGPIAGSSVYQVELNAQVKTDSLNLGGSMFKEKKVGVFYVTVNSANDIINCSSEASVAYICNKMNSDYDPATNSCKVRPDPELTCKDLGGKYDSTIKACNSYKYRSCTSAKGTKISHGSLYKTSSGGCWVTDKTYECIDGTLHLRSSSKTKTCSCFTGETLVRMYDGSLKRIDKIKVGDRVLGENGQINNVVDIEKPNLGPRKLYSFNDDKKVFVTPEHPFKSDRGWISIDPEMTREEHPDKDLVENQPLQVGDKIYLYSGELIEIKNISTKEDDPERVVYNLLLDGNNTYYANDYLVHNKPGGGGAGGP